MAVGVFRKIGDFLSTALRYAKDLVPIMARVTKTVAPVLGTALGQPAIGAAVGAGAGALENLVNTGDIGAAMNETAKIFNDNDVSPFIKFKRAI